MSGNKAKRQPSGPLSDEELAARIGMLKTVERGFFQILREDYLPPFHGRKKKHKRP
jgi:hypothetical protein